MFNSFEELNEKESYLLGFLYADGCITSEKNGRFYQLQIALAEKDKNFLQSICEIFNRELNKNYELKYSLETKSYKLSVFNVELNEKLINLGITPRKTYSNEADFFDKIPNEMKLHFIRGFYDGDGSICFGKDEKCRVGFISLNENLLKKICNYINIILKNNFIHVRKDGKYFRIGLSGNIKCKTFLDLLYQSSTICLDRKYNKYKEIKIKQKPLHPNISWNKSNSKWVVFYTNKQTKVRKYIGTYKTIKECVERYNEECKKFNDKIMEYKGEIQYE